MDDDVMQSSTDRYALSQAYRWRAERDQARQELRQLKERSRDTTTSAYDLMPEEDREALAWVREHDGLDIVKKLLDWVVGHCSTKQQLDFDFWLSGRVMYELGFDEDMADRDEVERRLLARLVPEGMEWPRYDTGDPVSIGDVVELETGCIPVEAIEFSRGKVCVKDAEDGDWNTSSYAMHPLKRPTPKVLDADGVEVREGDVLYRKSDGRMVEVAEVYEKTFIDADDCVRPGDGFTHRAPVIAADGRLLREGETVWDANGDELVIGALEDGGRTVTCRYADIGDGIPTHGMWSPSDLTHQRPVLGADGVPIKKGDTVWHKGTGEKYADRLKKEMGEV